MVQAEAHLYYSTVLYAEPYSYHSYNLYKVRYQAEVDRQNMTELDMTFEIKHVAKYNGGVVGDVE